MKKIVITGGLGYIGTEICKIYSGQSRFKDIVVLDSRFVSERVKQLSDWGMSFVHGSILDENLIEEVLRDADIVYHLAGITDVAYTKTESNDTKDLEIKRTGIDGTRVIMKHLPKKAKLFFPSTHVVFEGLAETKFDITEDEPTNCFLSYSTSKAQSESDLYNSELNYVIVRLGSVYGYSTDTMRINILPNLFSKITSQNGTIKLFSGGKQYKSLVNVIDVARACIFLAESDYNREIFHLSNENLTVKDISSICKKFSDNLNIIETDDEVPNLGYTLSNKKLLSTGFKFLYDIESSIGEMVQNWTRKEKPTDLEYKLRGSKEFVDERGKISNYELTEPINLIGYIESKKGSVRANHYHPIQEQKCLLIKGKYISVIKDLSIEDSVIETKIINEGDIAVIQPNVAHTMVFLEDSIFLNLVRGEREHDNYGITHTIPYTLVDEKFRTQLIHGHKNSCRSCDNVNLEKVISLGMSPLANNLLDSKDQNLELYPLQVDYCPKCHNCQLNFVVEANELFDNYLYVSSTAQTFRKHFEDAAIKYKNRFGLDHNSLVVDIGSNDGVFLRPLKNLEIKSIGVEPAKNLAKKANSEQLTTYNSYFDRNVVSQIIRDHGKAEIVTASNVFAHSDFLTEITNDTFELLSEDGVFIVEVQYLVDTMKDLTFDNIYHEHVNYWTLTSIKHFFENRGFFVNDVEHIDTHGGSIRVYVQRFNRPTTNVESFLKSEEEFGVCKFETYKVFEKRIESLKSNVVENFKFLKKHFTNIVGFGSPAKATTSLNYFGIDENYLQYTIDDNPLKSEKIIPGVNIPINSKEEFKINKPDLVVVLAWNFFDYICDQNRELIDSGVRFISIKDLYDSKFHTNFSLNKKTTTK